MHELPTTSTSNMAYTGGTQRPDTKRGEITARREATDKLLHELNEEISGLNGTFAPVLRAVPAAASGGSNALPTSGVELVDFLEGVNDRLRYLMAEVRSLRDRCEL